MLYCIFRCHCCAEGVPFLVQRFHGLFCSAERLRRSIHLCPSAISHCVHKLYILHHGTEYVWWLLCNSAISPHLLQPHLFSPWQLSSMVFRRWEKRINFFPLPSFSISIFEHGSCILSGMHGSLCFSRLMGSKGKNDKWWRGSLQQRSGCTPWGALAWQTQGNALVT